ncbi:MAG: hypothetical protein Q8S73_14040 [Deltaproteobacteria bacterium]|nr:hypothetical protein [Myxococcales bacterium]MDP3215223.1 hypothetical protein [Deltaproteobacteria bacterium]
MPLLLRADRGEHHADRAQHPEQKHIDRGDRGARIGPQIHRVVAQVEAPRCSRGVSDADARRATKLNGALDAIANRFGVAALRPADALDTDRGTLRDEVLRRDR